MNKIPFIEINSQPSALNTSINTGVASQLASQTINQPNFDNVKIEDMRGNPIYSRVSNIDKIGLAQKKLADTGNIISKSKFVRQLNRQMQSASKPNISKK